MNLLLFICVCTIAVLQVDAATKGKFQTHWETLNRTKDQGLFAPSNDIDVRITINPTTLDRFDRPTSTLGIHYRIQSTWTDSTIKWDKTASGIETMTFGDPTMVWTPEIVAVNAESNEDVLGSRIMVHANGSMKQDRYLYSRAWCKKISVNSSQRVCELQFSSWTYNSVTKTQFSSAQKLDSQKITTNGLEQSGWSFKNATSIFQKKPKISIIIEEKPVPTKKNLRPARPLRPATDDEKTNGEKQVESMFTFEDQMTKLEVNGGNNVNKELVKEIMQNTMKRSVSSSNNEERRGGKKPDLRYQNRGMTLEVNGNNTNNIADALVKPGGASKRKR